MLLISTQRGRVIEKLMQNYSIIPIKWWRYFVSKRLGKTYLKGIKIVPNCIMKLDL
jgi:hypothetical protein